MAQPQSVEFGKQVRDLHRAIERFPPEVRARVDMTPVDQAQRLLSQVAHRRRVVRGRMAEGERERSTLASEIAGLAKAHELLRGHTGIVQRQRIKHRITRHEARISELTHEHDELAGELERLAYVEEARRTVLVDRLMACLDRAHQIDRVVGERGADTLDGSAPMWSPWPVVGYRVWSFSPLGVRGMRQTWRKPVLEAECRHGAGIPHTDATCHTCGIYAVKDLDRIFEFPNTPQGEFILGVVALSGKVVEHAYGYRAEVATVVAAVRCGAEELRTFVRLDELEALFAAPDHSLTRSTLRRARPARDRDLPAAIVEELKLVMPEEGPWT